MKILPLSVLILLAGALSCAEFGSETVAGLVDRIKAAAKDKSLDQFLACSCWDRMPDSVKKRLSSSAPQFMDHQIETIESIIGHADPLPSLPGFKYNVAYQGVIRIKYIGVDDPVNMPYGSYENRFYLATLVKDSR